MGPVVKRFDVFLVDLDPTVGSEIKKIRPCLVVSPDDINKFVRTVIVAPLTTRGRPYVSRIPCRFQGKEGHIVLDQIRTVDKIRLLKRLGRMSGPTVDNALQFLREMFEP
jgi:mRNA interferase MazF